MTMPQEGKHAHHNGDAPSLTHPRILAEGSGVGRRRMAHAGSYTPIGALINSFSIPMQLMP